VPIVARTVLVAFATLGALALASAVNRVRACVIGLVGDDKAHMLENRDRIARGIS
jgi:hypothetical protein